MGRLDREARNAMAILLERCPLKGLTALLDANILYPAPTRGIFPQLTVDELF